MRYIIRNCPCLYDYGKGDCCNDLKFDQHTLCQDCTNCLIKQVIEKCKSSLDYHSDKEYVLGRTNMAGNILALFEIEEVNNDR